VPYWRLSGFYLFYFASLGILVPYWSLYLKDLGFTPLQIGELMAILMATKIVSPNIWGWIADHTGQRMLIVRVGSLLALLSFIGIFFVEDYWGVALVMLLFSFFWNAALPQFEANTLSFLGKEHHKYSVIRIWGSIGFIVAVALMGLALEGSSAMLLPPVLLLIFVTIWGMSLSVPEVVMAPHHERQGSITGVLKRPEVLALLAVCFLMQASHGPYYTFYTIYMEGYGYSRTLIGQLWALGVVAEVGIFLVMHRLVMAIGLKRLLIAAFALTALRWVLIGAMPENFAVVLFAQLFHAASFGLFHAVAIAYFHHYFIGRHHGRGQALYSSISFGAGGALGAFYSGYAWDLLGGDVSFYIAGAMSLLALLITWRFIGNPVGAREAIQP
jgi:PPP family 3-phenylpropionic acid transporter